MYCLDGRTDMHQQSILMSASTVHIDAYVGRSKIMHYPRAAILTHLDAVACACFDQGHKCGAACELYHGNAAHLAKRCTCSVCWQLFLFKNFKATGEDMPTHVIHCWSVEISATQGLLTCFAFSGNFSSSQAGSDTRKKLTSVSLSSSNLRRSLSCSAKASF